MNIDPNWIGALLDGASSIGLGSSQQVALQSTLTGQLEQKAADGLRAQIETRRADIARFEGSS